MRRAFTLLELLLVIGILGGLSAMAAPTWRDYQIKSDLNNAAEQVSQAVGRAKLLAQSGEKSSAWGYESLQNTLFMGESFAERDSAQDEVYAIPPMVAVSGLREVVFSPIEGLPSATGTIVLTSLRGEERQVNILIDRQGIAVNMDDKLTICHCRATPPHTMRIPEAAWPAHRGHGDYLGVCHANNPERDCGKDM